MAVIGTNYAAISAANYLNTNTNNLNSSLMKLSSGSRLANPVDDAAGVAVSGDLSARDRRLGAAINGAADVISFAQTADGFLSTIQSMLTRMSELAEEGTNGAFGSADRANYQTEYSNLLSTMDLIASNASFNGSKLFTNATLSVSINADGGIDSIKMSTVAFASSLKITSTSVNTMTAALSAITLLNDAIVCISNRRATVNADISKFNFHITNMKTEQLNVEASNSVIKDLDIAQESTTLSKNQILVQAATSMLAQANSSQQTVLTLLK